MNIFFLLNPVHFFRLLPDTSLLFLLVLGLVSIVVIYRTFGIILGIRRIERAMSAGAIEDANRIRLMHQILKDARQLLSLVAYLFGFCIFLQIANACHSIGSSSRPTALSIADAVLLASVFAADVFFVLLFLHSLQWYAAARLDRKMLEVL